MKVDFGNLFVRSGGALVPISGIKGFRMSFGEVMMDLKDDHVLSDGLDSRCCHEYRSLEEVQKMINNTIVTAIKESERT